MLGAQLTLSLSFILPRFTSLPVTHQSPRELVVLALLYLAWCDPAAGIVGRKYGGSLVKHRFFNGKSVEGFAAAFLVGTLITGFMLTVPVTVEFSNIRILFLSFYGGFIAALSEVISVPSIDDNLMMPLTALTLLTFASPFPLVFYYYFR